MIIFVSVHADANGIISFSFMVEKYSIIYMFCSCFVHLFASGHLGCFRVLRIVNSAVMNTGVHASFQIRAFVFSRYKPRSGIAVSYGSSILVLRKSLTVFHCGCTDSRPCQPCRMVPFLHTLSRMYYL